MESKKIQAAKEQLQAVINTLDGQVPERGRKLSALDALAEGYTVQRTLRSGTISRIITKPSRDTVVLKVCTIAKNRKKNYSRTGECVEVRVQRDVQYRDLVNACARSLQLEEAPLGSELSLFRSDGTVVPPTPMDDSGKEWSLGDYLKAINRSAAQVRLGVGYISKSPRSTKRTNEDIDGPSLRSKKTKVVHEHEIEVLYSAKLGRQGFDVGYMMKREEVFTSIWDLLKGGIMDAISPYHPEDDQYFVVKLSRRGEELLSCDENGKYTVKGNTSDVFRVIHQSSNTVLTGGICLPLYCIAADHSLTYTYQWESVDEKKIGVNSPVVWVDKVGSYRCTVSNGTTQCFSEVIHVSPAEDVVVIQDEVEGDGSGEGGADECILGIAGGGSTKDQASGSTEGGSTQGGAGVSGLVEAGGKGFVSGSDMMITKEELEKATNNFSDMIGSGGFGTVYKGQYRHVNVAVKVLNENGLASINQCQHGALLDTEVNTLRRFRHPNLLMLMCYSKSPPALVYPLMENMSLHSNLHDYDFDALSWTKRLSILKDACRGLVYLHEDNPPVVHHDVNSSNILIDRHFTAKLADFGFSIQLPPKKANKTIVTAVEGLPGTDGYRPPEYSDRKFSTRSDVYCMGVVILETYTGLHAYDDDREGNNLIDYTEELREDETNFKQYSDCRAGACCTQLSHVFLELVNSMTKRIPNRRPTANAVLNQLESIELK